MVDALQDGENPVKMDHAWRDPVLRRATTLHSVAQAALAKMDLLLIDDWGLAPPSAKERSDLLEVLDDRVASRSTLITSQLPVEHWHDYLGEPTLADAILDRLVHSAHRINLTGESMRKKATS